MVNERKEILIRGYSSWFPPPIQKQLMFSFALYSFGIDTVSLLFFCPSSSTQTSKFKIQVKINPFFHSVWHLKCRKSSLIWHVAVDSCGLAKNRTFFVYLFFGSFLNMPFHPVAWLFCRPHSQLANSCRSRNEDSWARSNPLRFRFPEPALLLLPTLKT